MREIIGAINQNGLEPMFQISTFFNKTPHSKSWTYPESQMPVFDLHMNFENHSIYEDQTALLISMGFLEEHELKTLSKKLQNNAIYDLREQAVAGLIYYDKITRQCFLMTDLMGCSPIYYFQHQGTLIFASRQDLIIQNIKERWQLNTSLLFEWLHVGIINPPNTLIQNIKSIPVSQFLKTSPSNELRSFQFPIPDYEDFSTQLMKQKLKDGFDLSLETMDILCSGGLDSSVLVALACKQLNKPVRAHTISLSNDGYEYQTTQILQQALNIDIHYFKSHPEQVFYHIDQSIRQGESEVVGILSVNASMEHLFAQHVNQYSMNMITGDDNAITPSSILSQSPGYYHLKYGFLNPDQSKKLLKNNPLAFLSYINQSKKLFTERPSYGVYKAQRLNIHATMIGKIIAKYRLGMDDIGQCMMPLNHSQYRQYIDRINYHHGHDGFDYRTALKEMLIGENMLAASYFSQPKGWMPHIWSLESAKPFLQKMFDAVVTKDSILNDVFDKAFLKTCLRPTDNEYAVGLLCAMYYLQRFCAIFALEV